MRTVVRPEVVRSWFLHDQRRMGKLMALVPFLLTRNGDLIYLSVLVGSLPCDFARLSIRKWSCDLF